jgi:hypothetical protein
MKLLPAFGLLVFVQFFAFEDNAQEVFSPGSRYQAVADACVALTGCWSVFGNQAGLAGIDRPELAGSFQNQFLIRELSTRSGLFVFPVQSSVYAVSVYQFGKNPFRQEKFGIAYARQLFPQLNIGVQFNYFQLFMVEDNRSVGTSGLELGFQYLIAKKLVLGIHVLNPYKTVLKTFSGIYRYPSRISFGACYHLSDYFSLTSELDNDFNRQLILRTGLEYIILEKLILRTGISGMPYRLSAGIGFQVKRLIMDLATNYGQYLGNSPSVSFHYLF